ncbi:MAG: hypothetical protein KC592_18430, partial [Nitrospira sp.]|nr:hypothetical protein [Nitrospira sp.]
GDALREVHRVLKKEGTFVVTVPTDKFSDVLLVPKVLRKFSVRWSSWYIRKLNARLPHYNLYSAQEWERHFEKAGFSVIPKKQFFSGQAGNLWSLFAMHMVRPCGFLKFVRIQSVENCMSRFLQFVCGNSYSQDKDNPTADYGYLFLVGMKK